MPSFSSGTTMSEGRVTPPYSQLWHLSGRREAQRVALRCTASGGAEGPASYIGFHAGA